jgi:uncharacterized protein
MDERPLEGALEAKKHHLEKVLAEMDGCVVALSGGVDSSLLYAVAVAVLGERALGVTARSETYSEEEGEGAAELARRLGGRHRFVASSELEVPGFAANPPDRCYLCKRELFTVLGDIARAEGLAVVVDGSNLDDRGDYRPGRRAAAELGVRSPLDEVGLGKAEIRQLSRGLGLESWDKPALACFASRFPYGSTITRDKLRQVAEAEAGLRRLDVAVRRVRHHGDVARLELDPDQLSVATGERREEIVAAVKAAGFTYVALDLEGYRTGAMNETLEVGDE